MQIFDFTKKIIQENDITFFETLSDRDEKIFSNFMVARLLSMNPNWIDLINFVNKYTFVINSESFYKLLSLLIPNQKNSFYKYVKGKNEITYNKDIIKCITQYFEISEHEAKDYYKILNKDKKVEILKKYGYNEKEIKKIKKGL